MPWLAGWSRLLGVVCWLRWRLTPRRVLQPTRHVVHGCVTAAPCAATNEARATLVAAAITASCGVPTTVQVRMQRNEPSVADDVPGDAAAGPVFVRRRRSAVLMMRLQWACQGVVVETSDVRAD